MLETICLDFWHTFLYVVIYKATVVGSLYTVRNQDFLINEKEEEKDDIMWSSYGNDVRKRP